ncbi:MAG: ABC transporter ATP-binding protein [Clostridiales bacterium]|nr:ABC transporter ATP-binding protein [Clostridiales bacterium]
MDKLTCNNITASYDGVKIIEDINIELNQGELVSLLGVSGVGKTTLFQVISGLLKPDSGRVMLDGVDITGEAGSVSYMLQKDLLFHYKTILDNVALPLEIKGLKKKEARDIASSYFKEFGLDGSQHKYPDQLSGGMRQRAALLRTYLFSNQVALLDEPFSALDTITKSSIHEWYLNVMDQIKLSTIFITHDIDEAIFLSDRIYIMGGKPGRIIDEIKVSIARPRDKEFLLTSEFLEYKRNIIRKLN